VVSVPYVWVLGRGVRIVGPALLSGFLVGTLLAVGLAALGVLISALANTNRLSLAVSLLLLLTLFAPTQLPALPQSWFGDVLLRLNPVAAGLRYLTGLLVTGHGWARDLSYLIAPVLTVVLAGGALILAGPRIVRLSGGGGAE
jgi:ABC-2 type transport system permease protein